MCYMYCRNENNITCLLLLDGVTQAVDQLGLLVKGPPSDDNTHGVHCTFRPPVFLLVWSGTEEGLEYHLPRISDSHVCTVPRV